MNFPILYKKASGGQIQQWHIFTSENVIWTEWGVLEGKMQRGFDTITEGKNTGKKNATTPVQQAEAEAKSEWEKKLKKGYVQSLEDAKAGKVDDIIEGGMFPMLAHKYRDHANKVVYPGFAQPKLDGERCIAIYESGKCTLWSRTRKPYTGLPHINAQLEKQLRGYKDIKVILDGELYNHAFKDNFEDLSGFITSKTPKPGHEVVQYHVYDIPIEGLPFKGRVHALGACVDANETIHIVPTHAIADEDELMDIFAKFRKLGYEGAMWRSADGLYTPGKRSYDLLKIKEFDDGEFQVVGVEEGRGKLAGHAIFICLVDKNKPRTEENEFRSKMEGEQEKLKEFLEHPDQYIGRMVTVQYQGFTKYGKPRFNVAKRFRDDI